MAVRFVVKLDKLALKAGAKLPAGLALLSVRVYPPPGLLGLYRETSTTRKLPSRGFFETKKVHLTPNSEQVLPIPAPFELDFVTAADSLSQILAAAEAFTAEVFQHDKYTGAQLLGIALVPLNVLLGEAWVEGNAPIMAAVANDSEAGRRVTGTQLGSLSLLLSLQSEPAPHHHAAASPPPPHFSMPDSRTLAPGEVHSRPHRGPLQDNINVDNVTSRKDALQDSASGVNDAWLPRPRDSSRGLDGEEGDQWFNDRGALAAESGDPDGWDAAQWRAEQEDLFNADIARRGTQRASMLETEWAGQNARRDRELQQTLSKLREHEAQLLTQLTGLEAREARLVAAEEVAAGHSDNLRRASAQKKEQVEASVRRLQAELEHALDIERSSNAEIARQCSTTSEAAAAARAEAAQLRLALQQWHQMCAHSEVAQIRREHVAAARQLADTERLCRAAAEEKDALRREAKALTAQLLEAQREAQAASEDALQCMQAEAGRQVLQHASEEHRRYMAQQQSMLEVVMQRLRNLQSTTHAAAHPDLDQAQVV